MDAVKELKEEVPTKAVEVVVAEPIVNDSSQGLAQLYLDLQPYAFRVRRCAFSLLMFSIFNLCSLEGIFGMVAACGVLCCAAPGSLGVAYAARCARISATIAAGLALSHVVVLSMVSFAVLPEMPHALDRACEGATPASPFALHMLTDKHAAAETVALGLSHAARKLQEVGVPMLAPALPESQRCEEMARMMSKAAQPFIASVIIMRFGLFLSAFMLSVASGILIRKARSFGANAM